MMDFFRKHWFDIGGALSVVVIASVFANRGSISLYQLAIWLNLAALFFHQMEEYRIAGTFPGMVNRVMYCSNRPDRYPLNANTAFFVNVFVGWGSYFLAAVFAEKAVWL